MRAHTSFRPLSRTLAALAVAVLSACATGDAVDPDEAASDAEELRLGTGYRYDCSSRASNGARVDRVWVALTSKAEKLTLVWRYDDGRTFTSAFRHDPSYSPTGGNAKYARYRWVRGAAYPNQILVYLPLREGADRGSVKLVSADSEGYSSLYFSCGRTRAVLDTGEPAPVAQSSAVMKAMGNGNAYGDPVASSDQGTYVYSVFFAADGTYRALNADARLEMGVWTAEGSRAPYRLSLQSGSYMWSGKVTGGKFTWTRGSQSATLSFGR